MSVEMQPGELSPGSRKRRQRRLKGQRRGRLFLQAGPSQSGSPAAEVNVGSRLREIRTEKGLSIRALAEKSGLNVNTLSLIENGKTSPSVSTLKQLAYALAVPIAAFFENGEPRRSAVYQKAGQRPRVAFAHGTLEDLGAGITRRGAEPFIVTLEPKADSGPTPIVHTGREFVYCLEGHIAYSIEANNYYLEPGDSLLFEAHLPHGWRNLEATPARMLLVLCPADEHDQPTERHFSTD